MNINRNYSDQDSAFPKNRFFQRRGDLRIRHHLHELEINYDVDPATGNFMIPFETDAGRTVVVINSETQKAGDLESRAIWKVVFLLDEALERDDANALLMQNARIPFGRWQLYPVEDSFAVIFSMDLPTDLSCDQLRSAIGITVSAPSSEGESNGSRS